MDAAKHKCVTSFESYSFDYDWKITQFKERLSKPDPLVCPEDIKSPPGKCPATTWRLQVWKSSAKDKLCEVSLTLTSAAIVWARVSFEAKRWKCLSISSPSQYGFATVQFYYDAQSHVQAPGTVQTYLGSRFTGYIPKQKMYEYFTGSNDNTLIINCNIVVNKLDTPVHVVRSSPRNEIHPTSAPEHDLRRILEDARYKDRYTDVTIVTAGKEFKAHKVVLATQSPFFETRLEKRWTEGGGSRIDMQDVPADTMDMILTYMYTGNVENIEKAACKLLPKAEEYQLEGLKAKCEEALSKTLKVETVIDILIMADTHNAKNLKQACLAFLVGHVTAVKRNSAWTDGKLKSRKELWVEVLEHIADSL